MAEEDEPLGYERADALPERGAGRRGRRLLAAAVAVIAFGGFAGLIYYAYNKGREAGSSSVAPIIRAADGPTKVRPEQPGGLQVPNQDKEVYSRVSPGQGGGPRVENLLPEPEQPLPRSALRQVPEPPPGEMLSRATPPPMPPPPPVAGGIGVAPQGLDTTPATQAPPPSPPSSNPPPDPPVPAPRAQAPAAPPVPPAPPQLAQPAPFSPAPSSATHPPLATRTAPASPPPQPEPKPAPPPRQAQTAAVGGGGYRVQIVALRSEQAALAEWDKLKRSNPDLFNGLNPNVVRADLGEKGVYYRLQVGPLAGAAQAAELCEKAKSRKVGCIVVRP